MYYAIISQKAVHFNTRKETGKKIKGKKGGRKEEKETEQEGKKEKKDRTVT